MSFDTPPFDKFKKPGFGKSFGKPPFSKRSSENDKPFERKFSDRKPSERRFSDRKPFDSERKPFDSDRKPSERRFSDRKPFDSDRKPFEKRFSDRKPFEKRFSDRSSEETPDSGRPFFRPDQPLRISEESNHRMIRAERPDHFSREKAGFVVQSQAIQTLAQLMDQHHLSEIEYKEGPVHIRLSKKQEGGVLIPQMVSAAAALPTASVSEGVSSSEHEGTALKSPMVGTVYVAAKPGDAPFVKVGDSVTEGQVVLIVEAMKVMNTLKAPVSGVVKSILIKDGEPVEYGQELMYIG